MGRRKTGGNASALPPSSSLLPSEEGSTFVVNNTEKNELFSTFGSGTLGISVFNWLTIAVGILHHFNPEIHMVHDQTHLEEIPRDNPYCESSSMTYSPSLRLFTALYLGPIWSLVKIQFSSVSNKDNFIHPASLICFLIGYQFGG